ncbi:MAG: hypothetical protein GF387_02175 [Candidatus Portnoybacteria bacterium]|nr:hypothetical protein [Candidatus Portnoybacteria bacterium]
MKKIVIFALLFSIIMISDTKAEDKDDFAYRTMEFSLVGLNALDSYSTRVLLKRGFYEEKNPLARPFVKNDLTFGLVTAAISTVQVLWLEEVRKKNKTLGYIVMGVLILAKAYAVYHNFSHF